MESGRQWYGRVLAGIGSLASLAVAIVLPIHYASQDPHLWLYIPLAAWLPTTIIFASIPIITAVLSVRWLRRRARERRAAASDNPMLLSPDDPSDGRTGDPARGS